MSNHRKVKVANVTHDDFLTLATTSDCVCIDMTLDFNQNRWLGQELHDVLIYFDNETKMNGLLSLSGCVKAPYVINLTWDNEKITDYFKKHIFLPHIFAISESNQKELLLPKNTPLSFDENSEALKKLLLSSSISHLIGERGSGKSSLLGDFIAAKIQLGRSILLSSPLRESSQNTFKRLNHATKSSCVSRETLVFCQPENLSQNLEKSEIIIIDEASTYPKGQIDKVIKHAKEKGKQLILSTTIEGYESTGQSYRLNHLKTSSEADIIYLQQPKRFAIDDPLYVLSKRLYTTTTKVSDTDNGYYICNSKELRQKEWTLPCFTVLQEAHYKTTPNDLARFYNDDGLFVIYIKNNEIIGALHAIFEKLPDDIERQDIYNGTRRVKNALTQQAILHAYGHANNQINEEIFSSNIIRVSRIATAQPYRRKKIATKLLNKLIEYSRNNDVDFISTSFNSSSNNIKFWMSQTFKPVRIGLHKNKSNDEFALLMLLGVSHETQKTIEHLENLFALHTNLFCDSYSFIKEFTIETNVHLDITEEQVKEELRSVKDYHRDLNWAMPCIVNYLSEEERNKLKHIINKKIIAKTHHKELIEMMCELL